jgi:hypothetical protein
MPNQKQFDVEVEELFEKVTVEIPGTDGLRAINLKSFKLAIDKMMNQAFYQGAKNSMESVEDIIERVFNR